MSITVNVIKNRWGFVVFDSFSKGFKDVETYIPDFEAIEDDYMRKELLSLSDEERIELVAEMKDTPQWNTDIKWMHENLTTNCITQIDSIDIDKNTTGWEVHFNNIQNAEKFAEYAETTVNTA